MGFCIVDQGFSQLTIDQAQKLVREAHDLLRKSLVDVDCYEDAHQLRFQSEGVECATKQGAISGRGAGSFILRPYLWVDHKHLSRSNEVLIRVKDDLRDTPCTVGFSEITTTPETGSQGWDTSIDWNTPHAAPGNHENNCPDVVLGLFVARDIREGDTILVDETNISTKRVLSARDCHHCLIELPEPSADASENSLDSILCSIQASMQGSTGRCSAIYCSTKCRSAAQYSHHSVLCGKNSSWTETLRIGGKMLLQVLAYCVQHGCHPLDHPTIARLTPQYGAKRRISLLNTVQQPIEMLLQLGVDIFADQRFDTWVLVTLMARIDNNRWGKHTGDKEIAAVRSDSSWLQR